MKKPPKCDWEAVEVAYRVNTKSVRAIADEHGITEGTIRARAKRLGWARDPEGTKREIVRSAMAGITQDTTHCAIRATIETEAAQDVDDMNRGLSVARACLRNLQTMAETTEDARIVKVIVDATKTAIETIRNIRGLDEKDREDPANRHPGYVVEFIQPGARAPS